MKIDLFKLPELFRPVYSPVSMDDVCYPTILETTAAESAFIISCVCHADNVASGKMSREAAARSALVKVWKAGRLYEKHGGKDAALLRDLITAAGNITTSPEMYAKDFYFSGAYRDTAPTARKGAIKI